MIHKPFSGQFSHSLEGLSDWTMSAELVELAFNYPQPFNSRLGKWDVALNASKASSGQAFPGLSHTPDVAQAIHSSII